MGARWLGGWTFGWWRTRGKGQLIGRRRPARRAPEVEVLESRLAPAGILVTGSGPGAAPLVQVFDADTRALVTHFAPFPSSITGGVRVAVADVNADGTPDVICAAGGSNAQGLVRVFDGRTFQPLPGLLGNLHAFGPDYQGGAYVAAADIDKDGFADIVVGADGAGPSALSHAVRVFSGQDGSPLEQLTAPGTELGGVRVAAGDVEQPGLAAVVTATGTGLVQHVQVFRAAGTTPTQIATATVLNPLGAAPVQVGVADLAPDRPATVLVGKPDQVALYQLAGGLVPVGAVPLAPNGLNNPVPVAAVDVNGDYTADLTVGSELLFGPTVRAFDGQTRAPLAGFGPSAFHPPGAFVFVAGSGVPAFNPAAFATLPDVPLKDRLALYNPATQSFQPLSGLPGFHPAAGADVYFIAHGWAPGWLTTDAKYQQNQALLTWWDTRNVPPNVLKYTTPTTPNTPSSNWMFLPAPAPGDNDYRFPVAAVGMAQGIARVDPKAVVIAYSWIDESATSPLDLTKPGTWNAYASEAYTLLNGERLADGVQLVLGDPTQYNVHLIGHSHGSKVVTTAALSLAHQGVAVQQLTLLDSPDSTITDLGDASNFNWLYLKDPALKISRSSLGAPGTTFVDNYVSEFGNYLGNFTNYPGLRQVVDVQLYPADVLHVFNKNYSSEAHSYAATWYAGASLPTSFGTDAGLNALGWSPLLPNHPTSLAPYYQQDVSFFNSDATNRQQQYVLNPAAYPSTQTAAFAALGFKGPVLSHNGAYDPTSGTVTLQDAAGKTSFVTTTMKLTGPITGVTFDVTFTNPGPGTQLTISLDNSQFPFFVLTAAEGGHNSLPGTISLYGTTLLDHAPTITFAVNGSSTGGNAAVVVSHLQQFTLS